MAVAYDNAAEATGASVAFIEVSFTVGSGSDRAYVIGVGGSSFPSSTSTTCGGVGGTQLGSRVGSRVEQWYGIAPASGTQTARWDLSASWGTGLHLVVTTFDGVDQTTPTADHTTATGSSTDISVTVPNVTANDFVVDMASGGGGGTMTVGADQTQRGTTNNRSCCSTQDGASGGAMTWTGQFTDTWATSAVRLVSAASAGRYVARQLLLGVG